MEQGPLFDTIAIRQGCIEVWKCPISIADIIIAYAGGFNVMDKIRAVAGRWVSALSLYGSSDECISIWWSISHHDHICVSLMAYENDEARLAFAVMRICELADAIHIKTWPATPTIPLYRCSCEYLQKRAGRAMSGREMTALNKWLSSPDAAPLGIKRL